MTTEEFWRLCPAQMQWLYDEAQAQEQRQDYRFAQIAWILAEVNRDRKVKASPFRLEDFLLFSAPLQASAPATPKDATVAQQLQWLQEFQALEAAAQAEGKTMFDITYADETPTTTPHDENGGAAEGE